MIRTHRSMSETFSLVLKLKTLLIAEGRPMILSELSEALGTDKPETLRIIKHAGVARFRHGLYTYKLSEEDIEFAKSVSKTLA